MHEKGGISARGLAIGAAIVLAGIVLSLLAAAWLVQPTPRLEPKGFTLQTAPRQDIAAYRREKQARLESSGRVDDTHVHIPIERAMQILAERKRR